MRFLHFSKKICVMLTNKLTSGIRLSSKYLPTLSQDPWALCTLNSIIIKFSLPLNNKEQKGFSTSQ